MELNDASKKLLAFAAKRGYIRANDLTELDIRRNHLFSLTEAGLLVQISRGLYRSSTYPASPIEHLIPISVKVPNAVFCLFTALQLHGLYEKPRKDIWVAMPKGSHIPRAASLPVRLVQLVESSYHPGIEMLQMDGFEFKTYSVARTVADCFKFRSRVGVDFAVEMLEKALLSKKTTNQEMLHYAEVCLVRKVVEPFLYKGSSKKPSTSQSM